jgi:hypothetical protein
MVTLKPNPDGSLGLQGKDLDSGEFLKVNIPWSATSANSLAFVAPRSLVIQAITARVETAGTDAGAVTAVVNKAASGTALTAGTALHSGTINLKGTAATNQSLTLASGAVALNAGDAIGIVYTGTMTAAVGVVTIAYCPA